MPVRAFGLSKLLRDLRRPISRRGKGTSRRSWNRGEQARQIRLGGTTRSFAHAFAHLANRFGRSVTTRAGTSACPPSISEARRLEQRGVSAMCRAHAAGVERISLDHLGALPTSVRDGALQQGLRDLLLAVMGAPRRSTGIVQVDVAGGVRSRHRLSTFRCERGLARRNRDPTDGFIPVASDHANRHADSTELRMNAFFVRP